MTVPTFTPFRAPRQGTADKPEFKLLSADFGDGYTQEGRQLNNIRRVLTLGWEAMTPTQAASIINFIVGQHGTDPFYYTPSDETIPVLWTCKDYSDERGQGGLRTVSLTLRQSFNLV